MRVLLSKFCEYAAQLVNGRHSMIGIFDNIVAPSFPFRNPPCFLCLQLEFEAMEAGKPFDLVAVLIDEDGNQMIDLKTNGEVPKDPTGNPVRIFIVFMMPPLEFKEAGRYRLDIAGNGRKVGEERLPVLQRRGGGPKLA
ncbi:MAG: DUF6941 family protein [Fimbriimonadaceae bacterium]